ncbi:MAG: putative DNA binding domain-containing protein [Candidatus Thiodiazotropha sp. (ex Myrtea sp. 'scaly one' KF741663)]|nr:putative DNA binding domain-containing protein [Candidatus Thiodiazotropha sp. (ex Myrtea sp. 'scaly one' KF741663)]
MKNTQEKHFEEAIEHHLLNNGYEQGDSEDFDPELCLEKDRLIAFIKSTQAKTWDALETIHGTETANIIVADFRKHVGTHGVLKVIREGFKCYGKKLKVAYFLPNNLLNDETLALYDKNVLSVTRQLFFSSKDTRSLDMVLFLNGIPIITLELKNKFTGQSTTDSIKQYKNDRDPNEPIFQFKKGALVHFAVDTDLAFMTTRLSGKKTFFLPFNLGFNEGAGNPPAQGEHYRTGYLWEQVLQRDSLLDILARFMHLQKEEKKILKDGAIKKISKETMIFPRYHQLDVVRRLIAHSKGHGAGSNYLVQHSAGSGKSNSIAWLAHRLSSLHTDADEKIFHSVIVITDRKVLDQQLQDTIYQFDHKQGVVQKIDEDTRQLVKALSGGTPIIITTIQKFPFISETLEKLHEEEPDLAVNIDTRNKRFAVIVDEAHSSQSGETVTDMKGVLNKEGVEEKAAEYLSENVDEDEDEVIRTMLKRGKQENLSFFAFTATPKYKTLKVFDEPGVTGEAPYHNYSMRQAIEEGFILDVLANYTTYKTYYHITQTAEDDPNVDRKKAARALARFLTLHPHNIQQKTEVMVEHFRTHVRHKIGGRAKAMVVTDSRLHAVRYKQAFDEYIESKGYTDVRSLVAFSGTVVDPDLPNTSYTEVSMNNGISERGLPEAFETDEYKVLLVAEKYQTGFDQPLLHTMYVDKKLSGIQAVQTLSRLNRTTAGKNETFVLDFRNEPFEIFEAFKPFYKVTEAEELTDPHHLYRLQGQIAEHQVIHNNEVEDFCAVYFAPKHKLSVYDHAKMNNVIDLAVERYTELAEDAQHEFKGLLVNFRNMYSFLSQVMPYQDTDLEKLYTYLRYLISKLPREASGPGYKVDGDVVLEFYRLEQKTQGSINLETGEAGELKGPSDVGTARTGEDEAPLSELVKALNERFGTDFTEADRLFFEQIEEEAFEDDNLKEAANANNFGDFSSILAKAFEGILIDRMEGNEEIFERLMGDAVVRDIAVNDIAKNLYKRFRHSELSPADQIQALIPNGESKNLEFKETFSLDVKKGTKEKYIEKSALKTIGAFLNTEGGDLLIGVNDNGDILGIDDEIGKFYKNEDKYLLNFKNHLKSKIGEGFYPLIDYQVVQVNGKSVLHVSCGGATTPCFLEEKELYVRSGPSTDMLEGKKQHEYIKKRF